MSRGEGMQTFDQHLLDLLRANKITIEIALSAATNPTDFKTRLALEGVEVDAPGIEEPSVGPLEIESDERF
jgi:Tfp pilus assembly ATPase PilU